MQDSSEDFTFNIFRDQINELHSDEKLSKSFFIFAIVIFSISISWALIAVFLESEVQATAESLAMVKLIDSIDRLLTTLVGIFLLVQCFKIRRIFRNHFNDHLDRNISFSGLATFFFHFYYLQYKINRFE